jgi:ubiquinone/menaquinone biosynthesis C-methylase UbiE
MKTSNEEIRFNVRAHDRIAEKYELKHTEIYNEVEQKRIRDVIAEMLEALKIERPVVLDFGSGTGNLSKLFLERGCPVTACDVSEKSLEVLRQRIGRNHPLLKTQVIDGNRLPWADHSFDVAAAYSVLHHIPDYLSALGEMVRVVRPGGLIYVDHEANENRWNPGIELTRYYARVRQTPLEHLAKLARTRELFTWDFLKGAFITLLINRRYRREGDIHVWPDDHIEWSRVFRLFEKTGCETIRDRDYLLYRPKGGMAFYESSKDNCTDTKYVLARKK